MKPAVTMAGIVIKLIREGINWGYSIHSVHAAGIISRKSTKSKPVANKKIREKTILIFLKCL
jgi:hypothetical protein